MNQKSSRQHPKAVWIELTNVCNLRCGFCFHANDSMTRPKGMMDFRLFKKIIGDVEHFKPTLVLHHSGESFLHRDLFKFIRYAKEHGLETRMTTNGTLLNEGNFGILETGLNSLNISLAGVDEEDYQRVRLNNEFKNVRENISSVAAEKAKRNLDMELTINIIETKYNKDKIAAFKKSVSSIEGVNEVVVRRLINWSQKVDVRELKPADLKNSLVKYAFIRYQNIKKYIKVKFLRKGLCDSVYQSAGIFWDGTVVPCCYDFNGALALGNVGEDNFLEIWNGGRMKKLRAALRSVSAARKHPICGPCSFPDLI